MSWLTQPFVLERVERGALESSGTSMEGLVAADLASQRLFVDGDLLRIFAEKGHIYLHSGE